MIISDQVKGVLLISARDAIRSLFGGTNPPIIDYSFYPELSMTNHGAFVTLTKRGQLRGCIGYLHSEKTLFDTVVEVAKLSAQKDPRFPPLKAEEMGDLNLEISVLSVPEFIREYEEIEVGKHGLIIEEDGRKAVLLPQVAIEQRLTLQQYLTAICQKAGLHPYLWNQKKVRLQVFTANVFSEIGKRKRTYEPI